MKGKTVHVLFSVSLLTAGSSFLASARTGFRDDFEAASSRRPEDPTDRGAPSGWKGDSQCRLSGSEGQLRIQVDKFKKWKSFSLDLGGTYDFSSRPFVNLEVRGTRPFILHVYLLDKNGKNALQSERILKAKAFVDVCFDFEDPESSGKGFDIRNVTGMLFTVNGAATSFKGDVWFDDLRAGTEASKIANIGGVGDQIHHVSSGRKKMLLTDIENASGIKASGASSLIRNPRVSAIRDGTAVLTYDLKDNATGRGTVTLSVVGRGDFGDNRISFDLTVEPDMKPTVDQVEDRKVAAGSRQTIRLSGISDGNISAQQRITVSARSDAPRAISNPIKVDYVPGSPYATLSFTPAAARTGITVTVTVRDDGKGRRNTETMRFKVDAYDDFNGKPTIDAPAARDVFLGAGRQSVTLSGIGDGDKGRQRLTITASVADSKVIRDVDVKYRRGERSAVLTYIPNAIGAANVKVSVRDDGGSERNNGDAETAVDFNVEVRARPGTGYAVPIRRYTPEAESNPWKVEGEGPGQKIEIGSFKGFDNVVKIECTAKGTWTGLWYDLPELDLSEHPFMSYDVYSEKNRIQIHSYFHDNQGRRNLPGAHGQRKTISPGSWHSVTMDFHPKGRMEDGNGDPINAERIDNILFNYHTRFGWPFTEYSGTLYVKNIRVGSEAQNVPRHRAACTIDPVADQVIFEGAAERTVVLSGITDGGDGTATPRVAASSGSPAFAPGPSVSRVAPNGTATLTCRVRDGVGQAQITLTVSARGSNDRRVSFKFITLSKDPEKAVDVNVDLAETHQTIRGFGTFSNRESYIPLYADELGASAVRFTCSGEFEAENDNSDPEVLNRAGFNYKSLDFDYLKKLKAAGVETFILSFWSPPAWMKDNLSTNYQGPATQRWAASKNRLSPYHYDEFVELCVALVKILKEEADIDLYALSAQNEPAFCEPYGSAILDPANFALLNKLIGARFEKEGIRTKLFMPEQVFSQGFYSMREYIDAVQADPLANRYTAVIATHGYASDGVRPGIPNYSAWTRMWQNAQEGPYPKELWMSETGVSGGNWSQALKSAGSIHGSLAFGNIGLWTSWAIEGQLIAKGKPLYSFYAVKNYYKFVRPGAVRVGATCLDQDLMVTAFKNDAAHGGGMAIVIINKSDRNIAADLNVKGGPARAEYAVYQSSEKLKCEKTGTVRDLVTLPARSITTLVSRD